MTAPILKDRPGLVILAVILTTLIAQIPVLGRWISDITEHHEHLVTLLEGIIGIMMLVFATQKRDTHPNRKP